MIIATTDRQEPGTSPLWKTGRTTGLWYLAPGITGMLSSLLIRPRIFVNYFRVQPMDTRSEI